MTTARQVNLLLHTIVFRDLAIFVKMYHPRNITPFILSRGNWLS
jgi:hypothetical protein